MNYHLAYFGITIPGASLQTFCNLVQFMKHGNNACRQFICQNGADAELVLNFSYKFSSGLPGKRVSIFPNLASTVRCAI